MCARSLARLRLIEGELLNCIFNHIIFLPFERILSENEQKFSSVKGNTKKKKKKISRTYKMALELAKEVKQRAWKREELQKSRKKDEKKANGRQVKC